MSASASERFGDLPSADPLGTSAMLAPELRCFAEHPCGSLDDPTVAREAVRAFLSEARLPVDTGAVEIIDHQIVASADGRKVPIRIYRPDVAAPAPGLVYFHGGAFLLGSPALDDPPSVRYAASAGCILVSIDYRLAPEHPFPAGFQDCVAALEWSASAGARFGIDTNRIAVGGSSAGGALAAAAALHARDRRGPKLCFQLLVYPVLDDRLSTLSMQLFTQTPVFARHAAASMWRHYLGDKRQATAYAAPARALDLAGLPPAYLEACTLDPLLDENIAYAKRLNEAGVEAELNVVVGAPHGFDQDYLGAPEPMPEITRRVWRQRISALTAAFERG